MLAVVMIVIDNRKTERLLVQGVGCQVPGN